VERGGGPPADRDRAGGEVAEGAVGHLQGQDLPDLGGVGGGHGAVLAGNGGAGVLEGGHHGQLGQAGQASGHLRSSAPSPDASPMPTTDASAPTIEDSSSTERRSWAWLAPTQRSSARELAREARMMVKVLRIRNMPAKRRDHAGDQEDLGVPALGRGGVAGALGGQRGLGERLVVGAERGRHAVAWLLLANARGAVDLQVADLGRGAGVGYLLKDRVGDVEEFVDAVRRGAAGGTVIDPEVVRQLLSRRRDPIERLTPREREVLALMAEGWSNGAIARTLVVTEAAVAKHIGSILTKLDLPPTETTTVASEPCSPFFAPDASSPGRARSQVGTLDRRPQPGFSRRYPQPGRVVARSRPSPPTTSPAATGRSSPKHKPATSAGTPRPRPASGSPPQARCPAPATSSTTRAGSARRARPGLGR